MTPLQKSMANFCMSRNPDSKMIDHYDYVNDRPGKECEYCEGTGQVWMSCCGDEMAGSEYEDYMICPTCKEHIGDDTEDCGACDGTGYEPIVKQETITDGSEGLE